jgi:hypothetical protein
MDPLYISAQRFRFALLLLLELYSLKDNPGNAETVKQKRQRKGKAILRADKVVQIMEERLNIPLSIFAGAVRHLNIKKICTILLCLLNDNSQHLPQEELNVRALLFYFTGSNVANTQQAVAVLTDFFRAVAEGKIQKEEVVEQAAKPTAGLSAMDTVEGTDIGTQIYEVLD